MTVLTACLTRDQSVDRSKDSPTRCVSSTVRPMCLVRHNVCHRATWSVPGAAQRMSPGDLERAWCGTTYVTGRLGACLVRHNVCHRATWSVPGAAQRMSPGDLSRDNTSGFPDNMPQCSALTFIVYAVTVSLSQGALERVSRGEQYMFPR